MTEPNVIKFGLGIEVADTTVSTDGWNLYLTHKNGDSILIDDTFVNNMGNFN